MHLYHTLLEILNAGTNPTHLTTYDKTYNLVNRRLFPFLGYPERVNIANSCHWGVVRHSISFIHDCIDVDSLMDASLEIRGDTTHRYLSVDGVLGAWPVEIVTSPVGPKSRLSSRGKRVELTRVGLCEGGGCCYEIRPSVRYYNNGSAGVFYFVRRNHHTIVFKIAGTPGKVEIPVNAWRTLVLRYPQVEKVHHNDIRSFLRDVCGLSDPLALNMGAACIIATLGETRSCFGITYFTHLLEGLDCESKPYGTELVPPVVDKPAVLPAMNESNDVAAVKKRIYDVNPGVVVPPEHYKDYIREFSAEIRREVGDVHVIPISRQDVVDCQKTAITTLRMARAAARDEVHSTRIEAFIKKEAYPNPKDPRNISNIDPSHNLKGFRYLIPLKQHVLKRCCWYAPGMEPRNVGQRLQELCSGWERDGLLMVEGDYSRYDGTQTIATRKLAFSIMEHFVDSLYRKEFEAVVREQFKARATTKNGWSYELMGSMPSGSWSTTDGNTLLNAFISFVALREQGFESSRAYQNIGIFFGDDSVTCAVEPEILPSVALSLGLKLKSIVRDSYVTFLSRIYPYPSESPRSFPDPLRALTKAHLSPTTLNDTERIEVIRSRFSAYLLLGPNTPLLSDFARKVLELTDSGQLSVDEIGLQMPYSMSSLEGPFEPLLGDEEYFALEFVAGQLNLDMYHVELLVDRIRSTSSLEQLRGLIHVPDGECGEHIMLSKDELRVPLPEPSNEIVDFHGRRLFPEKTANPQSERGCAKASSAEPDTAPQAKPEAGPIIVDVATVVTTGLGLDEPNHGHSEVSQQSSQQRDGPPQSEQFDKGPAQAGRVRSAAKSAQRRNPRRRRKASKKSKDQH